MDQTPYPEADSRLTLAEIAGNLFRQKAHCRVHKELNADFYHEPNEFSTQFLILLRYFSSVLPSVSRTSNNPLFPRLCCIEISMHHSSLKCVLHALPISTLVISLKICHE
jgi:hypothetical protein